MKKENRIKTKKNQFANIKTSTAGITLIALVITIIVLLILAGVSIATLAGDNGVLTKASDAKIVNAMGSLKDEVNLKAAEAVSEYYENIYVHKNDNGATLIKKYASMEPIREITKIAEETTNTKVFSQTALVRHIITKLAKEFTNNNTTGTEVSRNGDLTIAIKQTDTGSSVTGTITIKSKAVPSLKTVGTVQADGAIKWGDTFKRTASSSGDGASERLKEILNDEDLFREAMQARSITPFVSRGDYSYFEYEGEYYKVKWEETSPDNWEVTEVSKLSIDKTRFGVQDGVLVTPSTPDNLLHFDFREGAYADEGLNEFEGYWTNDNVYLRFYDKITGALVYEGVDDDGK